MKDTIVKFDYNVKTVVLLWHNINLLGKITITLNDLLITRFKNI